MRRFFIVGLVWLVLCFVLSYWNQAQAQSTAQCNTATVASAHCTTQAQARTGAMAYANRWRGLSANAGYIPDTRLCVALGVGGGRWYAGTLNNAYPCSVQQMQQWGAGIGDRSYTTGCPDGSLPNDQGVCPQQCTGGSVLMTNGTCSPTPEQCLARNAEPGFINVGETTRNFSSACIGGCDFGVSGPNTQTTQGASKFVNGTFEFSGSVCGASPQQPSQPDTVVKPDKPQECAAAGSNQTFCVKANGDQCVSTSTGRQVCWKPGETGEKTDGKVLQKRNAGDTAITPKTPPPDGDTFTPSPTPVTTTSTYTNSSGQTTIITTTTNNHTTSKGTNAGPKDQGQPGDGTGSEEGEEGGEKGGASRDCSQQPTCSQADGIGCAMLRQQWGNYCDAVVGDVAQIGNTDVMPTQGLENSLIDVWDQGDGYIPGPTDIDTSGWAGRGNCPINLSITALGRTHTLDSPQLCEILDALAALILIVGSWHAGFILTTGYRKG